MSAELPPAPPVEHHYTLDQSGKPIQVQEVIYIAPKEDQFHEIELGDKQLDFLEEMIENAEVKNAVISLNKMRRKLFRENGLLKKRMQDLEYHMQSVLMKIDALKSKQKDLL